MDDDLLQAASCAARATDPRDAAAVARWLARFDSASAPAPASGARVSGGIGGIGGIGGALEALAEAAETARAERWREVSQRALELSNPSARDLAAAVCRLGTASALRAALELVGRPKHRRRMLMDAVPAHATAEQPLSTELVRELLRHGAVNRNRWEPTLVRMLRTQHVEPAVVDAILCDARVATAVNPRNVLAKLRGAGPSADAARHANADALLHLHRRCTCLGTPKLPGPPPNGVSA